MAITKNERNYLLEAMSSLLAEYDYVFTDEALIKIIDEWAKKKGTLIDAFKNHPNYLEGKFMIAFDTDYERCLDGGVMARNFWEWLYNNAVDPLRNSIPQEMIKQREREHTSCLPDELFEFLKHMGDIAVRTISEETADKINRMVPVIRAHKGEKTSRVINRICTYLGYNKADGYNREFAKFADSLSPMKITRHTVLSISPLDYLTMSFGNSWSSCHTIDKTNKRGMPNSYHGCYSSGTMSYMLDGASMVFYTVDKSYDGNEYWTQPKINRQMFHYCADKLVQGRLYPQDNDGCGAVYTPNREIVQEIMSKIFDFPNLWVLKTGVEAASKYIVSEGTHYRDYRNYGNCTLSVIKGSENESSFVVGARPICVKCGKRHSNEENISCGRCEIECAECGDEIDLEDAIEIDGELYCRDCVTRCPICGEYVLNSDVVYIESEDRVICLECRDEYYTRCARCGYWVYAEDTTFIANEKRDVCENCRDEYYFLCDECDEYFTKDDRYPYDGKDLCESCYEEQIKQEDEAC